MSEITLNTPGSIASELGESEHRVRYIIRTRDIRPTSRAGHIRVFSDSAVDLIRSEIARIDAARSAL